ncbi:hypothetical protein N8648_05555 [Verrucomicrobia bacterium]|nr:hypothetical protein [Verrucomicrobiota bacterium]
MHDLWEENTQKGATIHNLATKYEKLLLEYSTIRYCMTETQKDYMMGKYTKLQFDIQAYSVDSSNKFEIPYIKTTRLKSTKEILYTGNISNVMNINALQVLLKH